MADRQTLDPLPMSHYKAQYEGVSRNSLLRIIQMLHADNANLEAGIAHQSRHLVRFNLHMAEAEQILRDLQGDAKVAARHKRRIERAFSLAQISEPSDADPPPRCPDCGGEIRHAGEGWHVCDAGCGFRSLHALPTPGEG